LGEIIVGWEESGSPSRNDIVSRRPQGPLGRPRKEENVGGEIDAKGNKGAMSWTERGVETFAIGSYNLF